MGACRYGGDERGCDHGRGLSDQRPERGRICRYGFRRHDLHRGDAGASRQAARLARCGRTASPYHRHRHARAVQVRAREGHDLRRAARTRRRPAGQGAGRVRATRRRRSAHGCGGDRLYIGHHRPAQRRGALPPQLGDRRDQLHQLQSRHSGAAPSHGGASSALACGGARARGDDAVAHQAHPVLFRGDRRLR